MFRKRHPPPGSRPGTLIAHEGAPPPRIEVFHYNEETATQDPVQVDQLAGHLGRPGVTWVDVQGLGDLRVLKKIAKLFRIHDLALEDVVNTPQRPKVELYDHHTLYISRMMTRLGDGELAYEQVSVFVGRDYVLTFQERHGDVLDPVRKRIHQGKGPIRAAGADYLAYAIIDAVIDDYYPHLEQVGEELEVLEDRVVDHANSSTLRAINRLRKDLLTLRRGVWPQRDAVNALLRGESPFVGKSVQVYLRDCYDHCVQIADILDTYREVASGLMGTYLSSLGNRTNEVMKVLTIMASIFIPITFLAGLYGMNFEFMPELRSRWSYPTLLLVMGVAAGGMLFYFYRRGWIGGASGDDEDDPSG